jgi:hypothetical protein
MMRPATLSGVRQWHKMKSQAAREPCTSDYIRLYRMHDQGTLFFPTNIFTQSKSQRYLPEQAMFVAQQDMLRSSQTLHHGMRWIGSMSRRILQLLVVCCNKSTQTHLCHGPLSCLLHSAILAHRLLKLLPQRISLSLSIFECFTRG